MVRDVILLKESLNRLLQFQEHVSLGGLEEPPVVSSPYYGEGGGAQPHHDLLELNFALEESFMKLTIACCLAIAFLRLVLCLTLSSDASSRV